MAMGLKYLLSCGLPAYLSGTNIFLMPRPPHVGNCHTSSRMAKRLATARQSSRHLNKKYALAIDAGLDTAQRDQNLLVTRLLDDLYWVMSYSRWKDERYFPAFRDALLREHPGITSDGLRKAQEFNFQRYYYAGIGRYAPEAAYTRGLADVGVLARLVPAKGYVHRSQPTSIDAGIYGFIANIHFYTIDTPLKRFVATQPNLVRHCLALHQAVMRE